MTPIKAVKVVWLDAESSYSWTDITKIKDPGECHTLGYLVKETDDFLHVSATIAEVLDEGDKEIHVNNTIAIPKAWIKEIYEIKTPKAKK